MANSLNTQFEVEGSRVVVVKITGLLDTNDVSAVPVVSTTGLINNALSSTLVGFRVHEIQFSGTPGLVVSLNWGQAAPQVIANLSTTASLKPASALVPNTNANGFDGTVYLNTSGFTPGYVYGFTLVLSLSKMYT